ncbi:MAG TPA: hypothetical protein VL576_00845 [Candidatus Paceibacterota bacterium]|nr:hypothetical protein [Candidatus Paceibacterota bacterium]
MKKIFCLLATVLIGMMSWAQNKHKHTHPDAYVTIHSIPDSIDERFGLPVRLFEITVPEEYDERSYIDSSMAIKYDARIHGSHSFVFSMDEDWEHFRGCYFCNPSCKLIPGKTYTVEVFTVIEKVRISTKETLTFLHKHHLLLVGAPGLLLALDQHKEYLPRNCYINSLDEQENLWADDRNGVINYPWIFIRNEEYQPTEFGLYSMAEPIEKEYCILAFAEKK